MKNGVNKISEQSKKYEKVQSLMHYINKKSLIESFRKIDPKKAVGVDRITKDEYSKHLEENIDELLGKMKRMGYRPKPTRARDIPKDNGKMRRLGISCLEDKMVEGIMADVLSAVYEPRFHDFSYGFRPGRSQHDAIADINHTLMFNRIHYVIEADITGCFDHIDHEWLKKFLENDIQDPKFIRYIVRFLKSGIMVGNSLEKTEEGTKQGNRMSPVLANVYLNYVLDDWMENAVQKQMRGFVRMVRFADDFVIMCQYEEDAIRIFKNLPFRLGKFGLSLNEDKSGISRFDRYDKKNSKSFSFLGFRFIVGYTRYKKPTVIIRTDPKKLSKKKQNIKQWLREHMHTPIAMVMDELKAKLRGHYSYYGVNGNFVGVQKYENYVFWTYYKVLRRRGQKNPIKMKDYSRIWRGLDMPKPCIVHNVWR